MSTAATTTPATPRIRGFVRRLTFAVSWGEGLDGYDLGVISVVLPFITRELHMSPVASGLIAASSLIGIFLGAPLGGLLNDRFGRKAVFTVDIVLFVILGLLQGFVTDGWQLLIIRILLGVAIGAEYSVGASMLAEFTPAKGRGRRLSGLLVAWYTGYLVAVVVAYALVAAGLSWRLVLASSALPAVVTILARIGLPESPRWLLNHGREQEARAVVDQRLGGSAYFDAEHLGEEEQRAGGFRALFAPGNRGRVIFISIFWACNVAPYFAIFTFAPTVLKSLHLSDPAIGTITVNAMAAIGSLVGMLTIERLGRRIQLIPPFWIMAVTLGLVGLWAGAPGAVVVICFAIFSFVNALQGNLESVYPIEVLPTEVRSTGVGFAAAVSRVGAAAGTFLLPLGVTTIGTGACMVIAALVCVVGAIVSQRMAPETTGRALTETSSAPLRAGAAPRGSAA